MLLTDHPGKSFYLAGEDGKFFPADTAELCGNILKLSSAQVPEPRSVRYAWADNPNNILYDGKNPVPAFSSEEAI